MNARNKCFKINVKLLPMKAMYFSSISAIGTLIPFIPVYMKELGLSSTETGIIYGMVPFISFFTRPLIGAFADKIRHHKAVLIACFLAMGLFYGLLLVTPTQTADCATQRQSISQHVSNKSISIGCGLIENDSFNSSDGSSCTITLQCEQPSSVSANRSFEAKGATMEFHCKDGLKFHCMPISYKNEMYACKLVNEPFGRTFLIFIVIYLFACIPFSSIYSLMDAIAYDILGLSKRHLWGRQRLWGTVGYAIFALISTVVMDMRHDFSSNSDIDYSGSFYIFIALCVISAIVTSRLTVSESLHCKHLIKNVTSLLKYPEIVAFMVVIIFIGVFFAVVQGFVFWYLQELGCSQFILGLCLFTNCVAEVTMFALGGKIIKTIGHAACLYIALFAYAVRLLGFSILSNVWQAPVIELTHGLCFGLMYDAATEYASIISPKGMSATVQGVIGGLYFAFGRGIGGLITGTLFDPESGLGAVWTFRLYGFIALAVMVVYIVANVTIFRRPLHMHAPRNMSIEIDQDKSDTADGLQVEDSLLNDTTEPCGELRAANSHTS